MVTVSKGLLGKRSASAWVVLLAGLLLTLLVWRILLQSENAAATNQFNLLTAEIVSDIRERLRQHEQILLGGAGLFDAHQQVNRREWRAYVARLNLSRNYPGIQGVGFARIITPADLSGHVAAIRAEGFPDYTVRPSGERPLYSSVVYLEPFSGRNLAAFGFDMFSEAVRTKAMHAAGESGQTAISGKVKLVQETHGKPQAGFLMYVPVYRGGVPPATASPAERWQALYGFVYSPYRVNDLMRGILGQRNVSLLDFTVHDGATTDADTQMYASADEHSPDPGRATIYRVSERIEAYGHTWTLQFSSRPNLEAAFHSPLTWLALPIGGLFSLGLFALTWSLSNRREREIELAEGIFDNVVDGIITIDERGIIASFNRSAQRIFGYTPAEVIGRNVSMLMPEPYHSEHDGYLQHYLNTRQARIIGIGREVSGRHKDGGTFPLDLAVSELQRGGRSLFLGMVRDITERKKAERMKSAFVSTVSHELRTPLTSINGVLGLLSGGALGSLPATAQPMIEIALRNSQQLAHLIDDLLDMEKMAAGKFNIVLAWQALMPLIEQAIEANQGYAAQHDVRFNLVARVDTAHVSVDASRLLQIMSNFLSNAAKFSPAHGIVEIGVRQVGDILRIEVRDHGPGIPDEFRQHVFDKFSQADASDSRQRGGTGLGLAISRDLAKHMKGAVGFESTPGAGALFYLDLPAGPASGMPE